MSKGRSAEAQKSEVLQGTLDLMVLKVLAALLRQRKWIASEWGASENNRKAKYYSITKSGRKQRARATENWERIAGVIGRLLRLEGQE